ncbi:MAG: hypothetical protein E6G94_07575 [Alphaproteobacteria bacterium]|nr:MAG: hypothetical protein E6G94_07575 [Alphaproteobacteria bacterium]
MWGATITARRIGIRSMLSELRASLAAGGRPLWIAAAISVPGFALSSYCGFAGMLAPDMRSLSGVGVAIRLALGILVMAACYRAILKGPAGMWRVDGAMARFAGGAALVVGAIAVFMLFARLWTGAILTALRLGPAEAVTAQTVIYTIVGIALSVMFIRTHPWLAALAIGEERPDIVDSWVKTGPIIVPLLAAWVVLVLPLMLIQALLNLTAIRYESLVPAHLGLAAATGILIGAVALTTALLNATALRIIAPRA